MEPVPERFTTPRLVVRRVQLSDAEALLHAYGNSEQATRYLTWPPKESTAEFRKFLERIDPAWDEGRGFHWIMQDRDGGPAFGMISLEPGKHGVEVGYVLSPQRWGRGYMAEGAQPPIGWALAQPDIHRVWATCDCENTASVRVLEKLGFQREGTLRRWMVHPNVSPVPRDSFCYSRLRNAAPLGS